MSPESPRDRARVTEQKERTATGAPSCHLLVIAEGIVVFEIPYCYKLTVEMPSEKEVSSTRTRTDGTRPAWEIWRSLLNPA